MSLEEWFGLAGVLGALAVVASVWVLVRQTRALVEQTRYANQVAEIANQMAGVEADHFAGVQLQDVYRLLFENPELGRFFYEDKDTVNSDEDVRFRVRALAEMFCDAVESAFDTADRVPAFAHNKADWEAYARFLLEKSPAIRSVLVEHDWWPMFARFHRKVGGKEG